MTMTLLSVRATVKILHIGDHSTSKNGKYSNSNIEELYHCTVTSSALYYSPTLIQSYNFYTFIIIYIAIWECKIFVFVIQIARGHTDRPAAQLLGFN